MKEHRTREQARAAAIEKVKRMERQADSKYRYHDARPIIDLADMFESSVKEFGDNTAFYVKDVPGGPYRGITYRQAKEDVDALGTMLIQLGLAGKPIAVIGENRYEWAISYLAIVGTDSLVVPLDKELPEGDLEYLIKDAGVECVIYAGKFHKFFYGLINKDDNLLSHIINMDLAESRDDELAFAKVMEQGKLRIAEGDHSYHDVIIDPFKLSILLYTSGTTGMAKGVMLSHHHIAQNLMDMTTLVHIVPEDNFFSVLPIHHTYECTCGFLLPLYRGAAISYCEGLKYIVKNLSEAKPTVFLGVPLIFEGIYKKLNQQIKKSGSEAKVQKILALNKTTKKFGIDLVKLLLGKVTGVFGGRMRLMIAGGAAIDPAVLDGLRAFGINALQGYGLTECSPILAVNPDYAPKSASAGLPPREITVKLVDPDDNGIGEIAAKGENIMMGYYHNKAATDEVLKDGWFMTGDLGFLDQDGYIHITGRKKNVIITKNGKNVYPEELEYLLGQIPYVEESMVWAVDHPDGGETSIRATIKPDLLEVQESLGAEYTPQQLEDLIGMHIDQLNKELPMYKKIRKFVIRTEDFEKTTAKKIKRHVAENRE